MLILVHRAGVLAVVFILQNSDSQEINFLFFEFQAPLWVILFWLLVLGALLDRLLPYWMKRRKASPAPPPTEHLEHLTPRRCCTPPRPTVCRWRSTTSPDRARTRSSCSPTPPASTATPTCRSPSTSRRGSTRSGWTSAATATRQLPAGWEVSWPGYGDDALAAAKEVASLPGGDGGIIGFGHSMGGAALLMAAAAHPGLFRLLVLFEPIVFPTDGPRDPDRPNPLRDGARRRRAVFDSFDAALANYASKPPMAAFEPDALDAYVRHGFRQDGDHVRLKCDPDTEADTFHHGGNHTTWDRLGAVDAPVIVVGGVVEEMRPSAVAELAAAELPHGRYVLEGHMDHFGPMTHTAEIAALIADNAPL